MAGGVRRPGVDLLLRALWIRQHHRALERDVHPLPRRNHCRWRAADARRADARLFLELERWSHALRHDAGSDLLRRWLREAMDLVAHRLHRLSGDDHDLGDCWICVVEGARAVVGLVARSVVVASTKWMDESRAMLRNRFAMQHFDVIVVGLGAMGSSTTYSLAERGERVLALDR